MKKQLQGYLSSYKALHFQEQERNLKDLQRLDRRLAICVIDLVSAGAQIPDIANFDGVSMCHLLLIRFESTIISVGDQFCHTLIAALHCNWYGIPLQI